MALNFPTEPQLNEIYTEGNRSWKWNERFWEAVSTTIGYAGSLGYSGSSGYSGSFGYTGSFGYFGSFGYTGSIGYTGSQGGIGYWGSVGYVGSKGLSAYEVAVANGFAGTQAQWLASLVPATLVPKPNAGIAISNNTLTTIYNTLVPDVTSSIAIGGAAVLPASIWKTKSIVEVLDTILFPDKAPTYVNPTISLTSDPSDSTKEIGMPYSLTLTLFVLKNDAGAVSSISLYKGNVVIANAATEQGPAGKIFDPDGFGYNNPNNDNQFYRIRIAQSGTVSSITPIIWSGVAFYAAGLPKQNNKGVTSTNFIAASSLSSNNITLTGIYPWFWGVSSFESLNASTVANTIQNSTSNKESTAASGTISITFNASSQFLWFAIPAVYTEKSRWFNTTLNQGSIGAQQFILAPVTVNVTSPTGLWSSVPYKIYISYLKQTTDGAYQFS